MGEEGGGVLWMVGGRGESGVTGGEEREIEMGEREEWSDWRGREMRGVGDDE